MIAYPFSALCIYSTPAITKYIVLEIIRAEQFSSSNLQNVIT